MTRAGWRRMWHLTVAAATCGVFTLAAGVGTASASSPSTDCAGTICTVTYSYTGGLQSWSVPAGVSSANFDVFGASGGSIPGSGEPTGGLGGETKGTVTVTPGQNVFVLVGGQGAEAVASGSTGAAGGYNGGGGGGYDPTTGVSGASGGGASAVGTGAAPADWLLVAGGGGGAASAGSSSGQNGNGGAGGGSTAGNGNGETAVDGGGGTPDAGGPAGSAVGGGGVAGTIGGQPTGGAGAAASGGGGGGGFYGGGGGGYDSTTANYGPGGGGSSYAASGVSATVLNAGVQSGNGKVVITYVDDDLSIGGVPSDITTTATGVSGAAVDYTAPIALDPFLTTLPTVGCTPASGSTFAVGTTTVTCSVSDADGETASAAFTVTVDSAGEDSAVPGATDVETGEPWAGSAPFEAAVAGLGAGLVLLGLARRRRADRGRPDRGRPGPAPTEHLGA